MKKMLIAFMVLSFATAALAVDKTELDRRAQKIFAKFESLQAKPDKKVSAEVLRKAQGIILLERTKAGFIFAYQGGSGLAMVKDKKSGQWGPLAFMRADEGSLGFQLGGQQSFMVILLMTPKSTEMLTDATFEFGGEARGTAGDTSTGAESSVNSTETPLLVYGDRTGLFGGAAIKGGSIAADVDANIIYYGKGLTLKEILFDKKVKPTEAADELAKKIEQHSKAPKE